MTIAWEDGTRNFFVHAYRDANHDNKKDSTIRRMYGGQLVFVDGIPTIKSFYVPV